MNHMIKTCSFERALFIRALLHSLLGHLVLRQQQAADRALTLWQATQSRLERASSSTA